MQLKDESIKAANSVSQDRLWKRLMSMAKIGALPNGGVNRQALSNEDIQARQLIADWAQELGFLVETDEIANLYIRLVGSDANTPPVTTGSHLDSQPRGGKFDGAFGVIGGFEALEAISHAGIIPKTSIDLVAWTNEEGGRFQPGVMGSSLYAGDMDISDQLHQKDADGIELSDALSETLKSIPNIQMRNFKSPMKSYIEAHIEQGPILEISDNTIGVVTGIQGVYWYSVEVIGQEAHAGTTPESNRQDALQSAISIIHNLKSLMKDEADRVRFTVGKFDCEPGAPSTIPGRVNFTIDFRHPEQEVIKYIRENIEPICLANAGRCKVIVKPIMSSPPVHFDKNIMNLIETSASELGHNHMLLPSGAGHDAGYIAKLCPTGMIFVPCKGGVSHNEAESSKPEDLASGVETLAACLLEIANQ